MRALKPMLLAGLGAAMMMVGGPQASGQTESARSPSFVAWLEAFEADARRAGVPDAVLDAAFADIGLNLDVIERDQRQPEFSTSIWDYLDRLVSDQRIEEGRSALLVQKPVFDGIEQAYAPPREIVAAIWGVESNFGSIRGTFPVVESLATLAYEGRREQFGRTQLIAALKILAAGDVSLDAMVGSWAGAMGHTQFIPTSFLNYAVDFTGDGRRDIWADDPTDALASTANYLTEFGWTRGEPWGFPVVLPSGFDFALTDGTRKTTAEWNELGVRLTDGGALPGGIDGAEVITPAGARGQAFLVLPNFRVIKRYNNANSYALAVVLLAERLSGQPARDLRWPTGDRPLSFSEVKELQTGLSALGFPAGEADGRLGPNTRGAIRGFQVSRNLTPDGYASVTLLAELRRALNGEPPRAPGPLTAAEIREIQTLLTELGFDTQGVDGVAGPRTRAAISAFRSTYAAPGPDEATIELLTTLQSITRD